MPRSDGSGDSDIFSSASYEQKKRKDKRRLSLRLQDDDRTDFQKSVDKVRQAFTIKMTHPLYQVF